ncbi:uncharacterized protein LOC144166827 [Haemaphysalis longicornis]
MSPPLASQPSPGGPVFSRVALAASKYLKATRSTAYCQHFANSFPPCFVEARSGRRRGWQSSPLFRAVLCRTSPSATSTAYRDLLQLQLLSKPCARNSGLPGATSLRQCNVPNTTPWDPVVVFGVCCPLTCGADVLGGDNLLPVSPIGRGGWGYRGLRSMRAPRTVQFYDVMGKLAGRDVEVAVKASVQNYGVVHTQLSDWCCTVKPALSADSILHRVQAGAGVTGPFEAEAAAGGA